MTDINTVQVRLWQLYLLRAMYLLIAVGLGLTIWPLVLFPVDQEVNPNTVVLAMLTTFSLLALLGLRYPLKMIPILLFELLWKTIWSVTYALPMWLDGGLSDYASEILFACMVGMILTPLAIPWGYVYRQYIKAPGDSWRR